MYYSIIPSYLIALNSEAQNRILYLIKYCQIFKHESTKIVRHDYELIAISNQQSNASLNVNEMIIGSFGILMLYQVDDQVNDTLKIQQIMKFYQKLACNSKIAQVTFQFPLGRIKSKQLNLEQLYKSISTEIQFQIFPIKSQGNAIPINKKFMIPKSNIQQIYFLTNPHLYYNFGCAQLQELLRVYQIKRVGQLGPLIGFYQAGHTYETNEPPGDKIEKDNNLILQYIQNSNSVYYSMIKLEHAFVSKHFLNLYYANLTDIVALREIVDSNKDCESIALNCLVSLYYPQLRPWKVQRKRKLQAEAFGYGKNSKSETTNTCLKKILQLYGYFPLNSYSYNSSNFGLEAWQNPAYTQNVNSKKIYFDGIISQIQAQLIPEIPFKQQAANQIRNTKIQASIFKLIKDFIQRYGLVISILSGVALLLLYLHKKKEQQQLYTTISSSFFQQQVEQQQSK